MQATSHLRLHHMYLNPGAYIIWPRTYRVLQADDCCHDHIIHAAGTHTGLHSSFCSLHVLLLTIGNFADRSADKEAVGNTDTGVVVLNSSVHKMC